MLQESSLDQNKLNFDKNKKLSDLLDEIQEKTTREIYEILGSKTKEYMIFREKAREIVRTKRPLFTATPEGREIEGQFQKARLEEANKFIKGLGINSDAIKSVLKKYQAESRSVIEKVRSIERLLDVSSIAPDVAVQQLVTIQPPYWFAEGGGSVNHSGSGSSYSSTSHSESKDTGEIHCFNHNEIRNPGDYAKELTSVGSHLFIAFQMPASGRINAWSFLECVDAAYAGNLWDEWGWSDATILQSSHYFMAVGNPPDFDSASYPLLYFRREDEVGNWWGPIAGPGENRYYNFKSNLTFSAGEWVLMRTGINDFQDVVVNDMEFIGGINNRWILRKLEISVI